MVQRQNFTTWGSSGIWQGLTSAWETGGRTNFFTLPILAHPVTMYFETTRRTDVHHLPHMHTNAVTGSEFAWSTTSLTLNTNRAFMIWYPKHGYLPKIQDVARQQQRRRSRIEADFRVI